MRCTNLTGCAGLETWHTVCSLTSTIDVAVDVGVKEGCAVGISSHLSSCLGSTHQPEVR